MGGGGDGFSIQLDDELDTQVLATEVQHIVMKTLLSSELFKCLNVEVWVLENLFNQK